MKIALLKNVKYDYEVIREVDENGEPDEYHRDEHVRISEPMDVEFTMIEADEQGLKVKLIDDEISKTRANLELLEQKKADLLCIGYDKGVV